MSSHRCRSFVLLGAFLVLLGFFFPLYSSSLLSSYLARGPLDQSVSATSQFLIQLQQRQHQPQIQAASGLIPFLCFLFYWLLLLLALLHISISVGVLRSFSSVARKWSISLAILGLVDLVLLVVCHTYFFVESVQAFIQRKASPPPTLWDILQSAGTPFFWRTLWLFCTSSSFGIWFPLLGLLTLLCLNCPQDAQ
ncbi:MAG: hypothetical protein J2P37_16120 [Ktedonobacteraceae bacterium]|nr:hypothetical protein [Ktedonobacteraceae bacterium]